MPTAADLQHARDKSHQQNSVTYGVYFEDEHFTSIVPTIVTLIVPAVAALVLLVCFCVDVEVWRGEVLCEIQTMCNTTMAANLSMTVQEQQSVCSDADTDISRMMGMYSYAIPFLLMKPVFIFIVLSAHRARNMTLIETFDVRTVERGTAGVFFWVTLALLDVFVISTCFYRYVILASSKSEYDFQLYPESADSMSVIWALVACTTAALGIIVSCFMCYKMISANQQPDDETTEETTALLEMQDVN